MPGLTPLPAYFLDVQAGFMRAWRKVGLARIMPLRFDEPEEGEQNPPYAMAVVTHAEGRDKRHCFGVIRYFMVQAEVRMPQGDPMRRTVEQRINLMDKWGLSASGASDFRSVSAAPVGDPVRFAGKKVDLIPFGFQVAYDFDTRK